MFPPATLLLHCDERQKASVPTTSLIKPMACSVFLWLCRCCVCGIERSAHVVDSRAHFPPSLFSAKQFQILDAMDSIKTWLEEHAPKLHGSLAPPASDEMIASFNELLAANGGITVPTELESLWKNVNGSDGQHLFPVPEDSAVFFSVADATRAYGELYIEGVVTEGFNTSRTVIMPDQWGLPQWIPIGWLPNGGEIFIDLKPGPEGVAGQVVQNDSEGGYTVLAPTLDAYLESIAVGLRDGVFAFDESWCALVEKSSIE